VILDVVLALVQALAALGVGGLAVLALAIGAVVAFAAQLSGGE